jgi:hypothetical protein
LIERLPHLEGMLSYIAPMAEKPDNLTYEPLAGAAALCPSGS